MTTPLYDNLRFERQWLLGSIDGFRSTLADDDDFDRRTMARRLRFAYCERCKEFNNILTILLGFGILEDSEYSELKIPKEEMEE